MKSLLTAITICMTASVAKADTCSLDAVDLRWDGGASRFTIELADDPEERAKGLMFRKQLGRFAGMLFAYPTEQSVSFWMENTLIPLDMLFFDSKGVLQNVQENAVPLDRTSLFGGDNIQYVLEVNGGVVQKLGIKIGAELRYPLIKEDAAWECPQ